MNLEPQSILDLKFFRNSILFLLVLIVAGCGTTNTKAVETETTTLFFVRHAEKAKDDPRDPNLTEEGYERSKKLADLLKSENIKAVYSTDYKRTRFTAAPTAMLAKCETQIYNHKTLDVVALAEKFKGKTVLIVGHSNSTPTLVNKLLGEEKFEHIDESDYGNLFKVFIKDGKKSVELLRY